MFMCVRGLLCCDLTRLGPLGVTAVSRASPLCTRGSPALVVFSEGLGEMSEGEYWLGLTDMLVAVIGNGNKIAVPDHFCPNSFKVRKNLLWPLGVNLPYSVATYRHTGVLPQGGGDGTTLCLFIKLIV